MNQQKPEHRLSGLEGDLRLVLERLEAAIARLIDSPQMVASFRERAETRIALILEERIDSVSSLLPYVRESWPTIAQAHAGVPFLEHLFYQLIEDEFLTKADRDDPAFARRLRAFSAFERLLTAAAAGDPDVARARAHMESDLRAIHEEDREWRWLNDEGEDS